MGFEVPLFDASSFAKRRPSGCLRFQKVYVAVIVQDEVALSTRRQDDDNNNGRVMAEPEQFPDRNAIKRVEARSFNALRW